MAQHENQARGLRGMVVAPQPRAAEVGAWVLARGGNAFDAAIATGFAQTVVDPFMSGIGGMGSCNYYLAKTREHGFLGFHSRAGSKVSPGMWEKDARGQTEISGYTLFEDDRSELGYTSIMTPGTVAGFGALHDKCATWDWAELMKPAMEILRTGFALPTYVEVLFTMPNLGGEAVRKKQLTRTPDMTKIWVKPDGSLHKAGEIFRNDDLLRTMQRLADNGPDDFYTGELAREIAADLESHGAFITAADLADYRVRWQKPLHIRYRGYDIYSSTPPASGLTALQLLNFLEGFDLAAMDYGGPDHLHALAAAMKWAHYDRKAYLGDPEFVEVPLERLLSKQYAKEIQSAIAVGRLPESSPTPPPEGTTQVTVWDDEANIVCMTHTLVVTSGVVSPGLGFPYNNSMKLAGVSRHGPNALAPRKARNVGMVPTVVFKDGEFVLAVGAPGGSVMISSVVQTILNVLHFGMRPVEAVSAPRIHCEGGAVFCESRLLSTAVEALRSRGHQVKHHPSSFDMMFSRPQLIVKHPDGSVRGASDPRHDGGIPVVARHDGTIGVMPWW